ncbi:hypothetical phage protein [Shigella phage Ag3]|uniref:Hypothetical phage protein n=1 Tax=Shigella phage Ag3 TaxID=637730 RepID=C8XUM0_9CAUD|nr:hypothetical protein phiSboM-AG3_gp116 [Shigella phage Ag3]ACO94350.1 hypothetical phage protein [Shigella phage Ag3]
MEKLYSIIVGADQGHLRFTEPSYVAHARVGGVGPRYVYCTGHLSGILHYPNIRRSSNEGEYIPLEPEDVVLARRVFIDFNAMHNNEIDARYHAMRSMEGGDCIYRIDHFGKFVESIDWFISDKVMGERIVTTPWAHADQLRVSTDAYKEVDNLCNKFRISVTCNQDLGEEIQWTAQSPHFSDLVMRAETRSRAVVQLVLWAFYQRTPFSYMGQKAIDELLKSHAVEV